AKHRKKSHATPDPHPRLPTPPTQRKGKDDRRRRDDHAARKSALEQKADAGQRPRLRVEAPFEIFVSRVDLRAVKERHYRYAKDDHRNRQSEIELNEPHPVGVSLPR